MTNRAPVRYCAMTMTMACFLSSHHSLVRSYKEMRMKNEKMRGKNNERQQH